MTCPSYFIYKVGSRLRLVKFFDEVEILCTKYLCWFYPLGPEFTVLCWYYAFLH